MSKKLTLDVISMQEDFFEGSYMLGIVSSYAPARMAWHLNSALNTRFSNSWQQDIKLVKQRSGKEIHFTIFQMVHELKRTEHILYALKSGTDRLLPELKNLDYLWLIKGATAQQDVQTYALGAPLITGIQLAQIIPMDKLTHPHNLLV